MQLISPRTGDIQRESSHQAKMGLNFQGNQAPTVLFVCLMLLEKRH